MIDIDFAGIENLRRLYEKINQEKELRQFFETERTERILKLSKLPKRFSLEESLLRMIGYFVIQIHLTYNLPQLFDADRFRT